MMIEDGVINVLPERKIAAQIYGTIYQIVKERENKI